MTDALRPKRQTHFIVHQLDGDVLLYDPIAERTHRLNASAALIWQNCTGELTVEELAALLTERFEVDDDVARRDTRDLVRQFEQDALVCSGT